MKLSVLLQALALNVLLWLSTVAVNAKDLPSTDKIETSSVHARRVAYSEQAHSCNIKGAYPQFSGGAQDTVTAINAAIDALVTREVKEIKKEAAGFGNGTKGQPKGDGDFDYKIVFENPQYLSLIFTFKSCYGGVLNVEVKTLNFQITPFKQLTWPTYWDKSWLIRPLPTCVGKN